MLCRSFSLAFSYTSEYSGDSTQLTYLRSRYYASGTGRFLTRDTWNGNANSPMSFNRWNYGDSNPISHIDPTGTCWVTVGTKREWLPDGAQVCQPDYGMTPGAFYNTPISSRAQISTNSLAQVFGGKQLWKVYLAMTCKTDAWWYADLAHPFDYELFIGLMIIQEANIQYRIDGNIVTFNSDYLKRAEVISDVVATVSKYGGHNNYSCPPIHVSCISSVFNFWADHSEVAQARINELYHLIWNADQDRDVADMNIDEYANSGPASIGQYYSRVNPNERITQDLVAVLSQARIWGHEALNKTAKPDGPIMYGSDPNWTGKLGTDYKLIPGNNINGTVRNTIYYYQADGWIAYTASQYAFWKGELGNIVDNMKVIP